MGASQYRGGRGNTATNSNCFADSCVERYSVWAGNANTYSDRDRDPDSNSDGNSDRHGYAECYTYSKWNSDADSDSDSIDYAYGYPTSDTKVSPDSASSSACPIRESGLVIEF